MNESKDDIAAFLGTLLAAAFVLGVLFVICAMCVWGMGVALAIPTD